MPQLTLDQAFQLARQHHQAGRLQQAEQLYRQILAHHPDHSEALCNLGNALFQRGDYPGAIAAFRRAISLQPNLPGIYRNLGMALKADGQLEEAIMALRQAIAGRANFPEAYNNLGVALKAAGKLEEAVAAYRQAISLKPDWPVPHNNLGNALGELGDHDAAIAAHRRAIALNPNYAEAVCNLANRLKDVARLDEAIVEYRRAISLKGDYAEAHWNLGLSLLTRGDLAEGWEEYEWRRKCREFAPAHRNFPQPLWDGRPLAGASLLLHPEQGLGDTIQFIRYLPLVSGRGGKVIVECQPELHRLIQANAGDCVVVTQGQPLPRFDYHCPLMSLARVFRTTQKNMPSRTPYLACDVRLAEKWRERLGNERPWLKIGLAWAGSTTNINDRNRSMPLSAFAPLGQCANTRFISLQKGAAAIQAANPPTGMELIDPTPELHDFADTAALIATLDLVITVDTAVAHLAGAMGKPVWTLLPFWPDWRWMLNRKDTPWYPTMRLFRQPTAGDWQSVTRDLAAALAAYGTAMRFR